MASDRGFDDEVHRDLDGERSARPETYHRAEADRFREAMASYVGGLEEPGPELDRAVMQAVEGRPRRAGPRRWRRRYAVGGLLAASVIAALAVMPEGRDVPATDVPSRLRSVADEGVLKIAVVGPRDGATLEPGEAMFEWRSVGTDVLYRLTLADERGDQFWTGTTTNSTLRLPSGVELLPGRSYFWYVDALLPDAVSATTGVRRFETAR